MISRGLTKSRSSTKPGPENMAELEILKRQEVYWKLHNVKSSVNLTFMAYTMMLTAEFVTMRMWLTLAMTCSAILSLLLLVSSARPGISFCKMEKIWFSENQVGRMTCETRIAFTRELILIIGKQYTCRYIAIDFLPCRLRRG